MKIEFSESIQMAMFFLLYVAVIFFVFACFSAFSDINRLEKEVALLQHRVIMLELQEKKQDFVTTTRD